MQLRTIGAMAISSEPALLAPSARTILARNMRRLRGELGFSQEELAFESGLHRTFIAHVETERRNVSLDNVEKIAVALHVSVSDILKI